MPRRRIHNFGRNLEFHPAEIHAPRSEEELLAILAQCRGRRVRAVGRLHSWSEAAVAQDVMLDLRHFDQVRLEQRDGRHWITVGAGCQIKRLLAELDRRNAGTLPSLGLVAEQTIAGALSTATHGSGRHSMSHYVEEVRVAGYDPATGEPAIRVIGGGPELQAARCSLGAMGVIVSVSLWSRPQYAIEEHLCQYATLGGVLSKEREYPLQQFYLMPWCWRYFAQHRRETDAGRGNWSWLYRWYFFLTFDLGLHLAILLLVRVLRSSRAARFFLRCVAPRLVIQNWPVVDQSQQMLLMRHELFRHIEIEMFVKRSHLHEAMGFVVCLLRHLAGDRTALDKGTRAHLRSLGLLAEADRLSGSYTHHYPICIRQVLPDDTLISMTSGHEEPAYAISFISYASPGERHTFFEFANLLCKAMAAMFDGRPHWGKLCPLSREEMRRLYPKFAQFREICATADPHAAFANEWTQQWLCCDTKAAPEVASP